VIVNKNKALCVYFVYIKINVFPLYKLYNSFLFLPHCWWGNIYILTYLPGRKAGQDSVNR